MVAATSKFRQRKISVKQSLPVLYQRDLPENLDDVDEQREILPIETGVEKHEEEEHHLKQIIARQHAVVINNNDKKSNEAPTKQVELFIPTPEVQAVVKDYGKLYHRRFQEPVSYIKYSKTVKETSGCPYCMDEQDEKFLQELNSSRKGMSSAAGPPPVGSTVIGNVCSEDMFEQIMYLLERTIQEKQPFLSLSVSEIMSYEDMEPFFANYSAPVRLFLRLIYPHWRERRLERKGKILMPLLRFEDSEKDDGDPYVCFRRREFRQVRRTRRTDSQSSEKLGRLHSEMELACTLIEMVVRRERGLRESLQLESEIFNLRTKTKAVKRKLSIKGDDELFVNHKKKRPTVEDKTEAKAAVTPGQAKGVLATAGTAGSMGLSTQGALSGTPQFPAGMIAGQIPGNGAVPRLPSSKVPEVELVSLETVRREKALAIQAAVQEKLARRKEAEAGWTDYTENSINPKLLLRNATPTDLLYHASSEDGRNILGTQQPIYAFRRRFGRGGRQFIDRRGLMRGFGLSENFRQLVQERYKFDLGG